MIKNIITKNLWLSFFVDVCFDNLNKKILTGETMSLFNLLKKIKIYDIFGIRLKFNRAMQSLRKTAKLDAVKISTYLNINSLSTDEKIRYLSQNFYRYAGY